MSDLVLVWDRLDFLFSNWVSDCHYLSLFFHGGFEKKFGTLGSDKGWSKWIIVKKGQGVTFMKISYTNPI